MIQIYWVSLFISVMGIFFLVSRNRLQNVYHVLLVATVVVSNAGYLALGLSRDLSTAVLATKISYVGCFLPFFLFMTVTELCQIKVKPVMTIALAMCSGIVLLLAFSIGYSDIYYNNVELQVIEGVGHLVKSYGPGHLLYDSLMLFYMITIVGFLLFAFTKQTQVSYKTILVFAIALGFGIGVYELQRFAVSDFPMDLMPVTYNIIMLGLLISSSRISMYDMSHNVMTVWEHMGEYGYIAFDTYRNYMGCNLLASRYFEKLSECKIDYPIENTGDERLDELVEWLGSYHRNVAVEMKTVEFDKRVLRFNIRDMYDHGRKCGYLIEFYDVTQEQKYIDMIEHYNADLEQEVDAKIEHISYIKDMMVMGMASMVENRDNSTGGHIRRTSEVVAVFAGKLLDNPEQFHVTREYLNMVIKAAPMHDLGKIAINDSILRKQGDYIEKEYEEMKMHAAQGARIVDAILKGVEDEEFVEIARNMAHFHHEKWNGKGYPSHLKGTDIPLEARIMALADVFDALVSKRCYKEAFTYEETFQLIEKGLGEQFDPELGKVFLSCRPQLVSLYEKWKLMEDFKRNEDWPLA